MKSCCGHLRPWIMTSSLERICQARDASDSRLLLSSVELWWFRAGLLPLCLCFTRASVSVALGGSGQGMACLQASPLWGRGLHPSQQLRWALLGLSSACRTGRCLGRQSSAPWAVLLSRVLGLLFLVAWMSSNRYTLCFLVTFPEFVSF